MDWNWNTLTVSHTKSLPYLPLELLYIIFGFLQDEIPDFEESIDYSNPTLFPYAIASVCKQWRAAMIMFPEFWTNLIISTDPLDLNFIQNSLEWSRERKINIVVVSRRHSDVSIANVPIIQTDPDEERRVMQNIIHILLPHIHRALTLQIKLWHTSSLPRISIDFPIICSHLTMLRLSATTSNGIGGLSLSSPMTMYQFPLLEELSLDGWNAVDILRRHAWWFEAFSRNRHSEATPKTFYTFGISNFSTFPEGAIPSDLDAFSSVTIKELFSTLAEVEILTFDNVELEMGSVTEDEVIDMTLASRWVHEITVSSLNASMMSRLFEIFIDIEHLCIKNCCLSGITFLPHSTRLTFDNVVNLDFSLLEGHTFCRDIFVDNCHLGIVRDIIKMLGETTELHGYLKVEDLEMLKISWADDEDIEENIAVLKQEIGVMMCNRRQYWSSKGQEKHVFVDLQDRTCRAG